MNDLLCKDDIYILYKQGVKTTFPLADCGIAKRPGLLKTKQFLLQIIFDPVRIYGGNFI
jgi:hypothetical protein